MGPTDPGFWKPAVESYLTDSLAEKRSRAKLLAAKKASLRIALIAIPLHDARGAHIGALALVTQVRGDDAREQIALLESLAALTSYVSGLVGTRPADPGDAPQAPSQALARAAEAESVEELAFKLTNGLRNKLGCEQVALSLIARHTIKLVSISGLDEIRPRSPGVVQIRAAMEECLDAAQPIAYDADRAHDVGVRHYRLHKQWHTAARGAAVVSIPLRAGEQLTAIISLRRTASEPFTEEQIEQIRAVVEPFAPALLLVKRAVRGVVRHASDTIGEWCSTLMRRGRIARKIGVGVFVAVSLWFFFGTLEYSVSAPCRILSAELRHITMPLEGVLAQTHVVAGDRVRTRDVLCVIDHRHLEAQRRELLAERAVYEHERLSAMAEEDRVGARLADAQGKLVDAKLVILAGQIERATVRSPIDGIVLTGDLRSRVGGTFAQGDPLFQLAPLDDWRLEIEIPEAAAADVHTDLQGRFAGLARPEQSRALRVLRVQPSAESRGGRNVYIAEAQTDIDASWMRPGMEGVARIDVGRRRVWWVTLHKVFDYLRLHFWL